MQIFQKEYGASSGEEMLHDLAASVKRYNSEQQQECCKMAQVEHNIVIAICTPLMQRVHRKHPCSGELVFVDASAGMDRFDCQVFVIMTHSAAGGLPLGILFTTSSSRATVTAALNLYTELLSSDAFYGRGERGPQVFMTDDCDTERQSLAAVFPESTLLLCIFHVLQAAWRFLWNARNAIRLEDRAYLLGLVKSLVYAASDADITELYANIQRDETARQYRSFLLYVASIYERRHMWAVCYRVQLPVRGNNTNNYVEAFMRVLKDQIFERVRAYNPIKLLDFMMSRMIGYYERRLTDLANGRMDAVLSKRYLPGGPLIAIDDVKRLNQGMMFEVRSQSDQTVTYTVDMSVSMCTCPIGFNGAPCKHQYACMKHFGIHTHNFHPIDDEEMRAHLLYLATGQDDVQSGWFAPLRSVPVASGSSSASSRSSDATPGPTSSASSPSSPSASSASASASSASSASSPSASTSEYPLNDDGTMAVDESAKLAAASLMTRRITGIKRVNDILIAKLSDDPDTIGPAIDQFIAQFDNLRTSVATVSALRTFGKYTGAGAALSSSRHKRHGTQIGVQPTAIARRTTVLGGRRCLHTGRKASKSEVMRDRSHLLPKRRPARAPHSLSQCVKSNTSLGKNHSSKW